jgi:acyl carrier protein
MTISIYVIGAIFLSIALLTLLYINLSYKFYNLYLDKGNIELIVNAVRNHIYDANHIEQTVIRIIASQQLVPSSTIKAQDNLESLDFDSLNFIETIMQVENELFIHLEKIDIEQLKTVQDFIDYVNSVVIQKTFY